MMPCCSILVDLLLIHGGLGIGLFVADFRCSVIYDVLIFYPLSDDLIRWVNLIGWIGYEEIDGG